MSHYMISYDLDAPKQNYDAVHKLLKSWGAERVLESTWIAKLDNTSCASIRNEMAEGPIDKNDRLLVLEIGKWATHNPMKDISNL